jgi:hypothetical protein
VRTHHSLAPVTQRIDTARTKGYIELGEEKLLLSRTRTRPIGVVRAVLMSKGTFISRKTIPSDRAWEARCATWDLEISVCSATGDSSHVDEDGVGKRVAGYGTRDHVG